MMNTGEMTADFEKSVVFGFSGILQTMPRKELSCPITSITLTSEIH